MSDEKKSLELLDQMRILPDVADQNKFDRFMDNRKKTLIDEEVSKEEAKIVLQPTIDATHSGLIVNNRVYRAQAMKASIPTWTKPYERPFLTHHNQRDDPIGRIKNASFVPLVDQALWETDHIDAIKPSNKVGSGFTRLKGNITDEQAIEKVLDGRYATVSVGFSAKDAWCSICDTNWATSDAYFAPCDHRPGKLYQIDEKSIFWTGRKTKKDFPMFLHIGAMDNRECSFVNTPAQQLASVEKMKLIAADMNLDDNEVMEIMKMLYSDAAPSPDVLSSLVLTDGYTEQEVLVDDLISKKPRGFTLVEAPALDNANDGTVNDQDGDGGSASDGESDYTDDEFARVHVMRSMFDAGYLDDITEDEAEELADFSDAKLSGKQRKKLASSTFCGPNQTFPVSDSDHVKAARSLIDRYEGPGKKSSILACINRKAKSLGCSVKSKDGSSDESGKGDKMGGDNDSTETTIKTLTDKIEEQAAALEVKDTEVKDSKAQVETLEKAREEIHAELTDSLVGQFVSMRQVIDPEACKDEDEFKKLVESLKLRSVDSLRDSIKDMNPSYAKKLVELQKGSLTDNAGGVDSDLDDDDNTDQLSDEEKKEKAEKERLAAEKAAKDAQPPKVTDAL